MHYLLIFVGLVNLALGALVWCKNKKNPRNIWFFILVLCASLWCFGIFIFDYILSRAPMFSQQALLWADRISMGLACFIPTAIFLLSFYFPRRQNLKKWQLAIALIIGLSFVALGVNVPRDVSNDYIVRYSRAELIFDIYFLALVVWSVVRMVVKLKNFSRVEKTKVKLFLAGLITSSLIGIVNNSIIMVIFQEYNYSPYKIIGPVSSLILVSFTAYAILKYRFMDIKIIFRKSLIIALSVVIVSVFILAVGLLASKILILGFNLYTIIILIITVALSFAIADQLKKFLDKVFLKQYYDLSKKIEKVKSELRATDTLEKLSIRVINKLKEVFGIESSHFFARSMDKTKYVSQYPKLGEIVFDKNDPTVRFIFEIKKPIVKDEIGFLAEETPQFRGELKRLEKIMEKLGWGIVFPLIFKEHNLGMLTLSKSDGAGSYSADKVESLASFNAELAHALQCVLDFEGWREKIGA